MIRDMLIKVASEVNFQRVWHGDIIKRGKHHYRIRRLSTGKGSRPPDDIEKCKNLIKYIFGHSVPLHLNDKMYLKSICTYVKNEESPFGSFEPKLNMLRTNPNENKDETAQKFENIKEPSLFEPEKDDEAKLLKAAGNSLIGNRKRTLTKETKANMKIDTADRSVTDSETKLTRRSLSRYSHINKKAKYRRLQLQNVRGYKNDISTKDSEEKMVSLKEAPRDTFCYPAISSVISSSKSIDSDNVSKQVSPPSEQSCDDIVEIESLKASVCSTVNHTGPMLPCFDDDDENVKTHSLVESRKADEAKLSAVDESINKESKKTLAEETTSTKEVDTAHKTLAEETISTKEVDTAHKLVSNSKPITHTETNLANYRKTRSKLASYKNTVNKLAKNILSSCTEQSGNDGDKDKHKLHQTQKVETAHNKNTLAFSRLINKKANVITASNPQEYKNHTSFTSEIELENKNSILQAPKKFFSAITKQNVSVFFASAQDASKQSNSENICEDDSENTITHESLRASACNRLNQIGPMLPASYHYHTDYSSPDDIYDSNTSYESTMPSIRIHDCDTHSCLPRPQVPQPPQPTSATNAYNEWPENMNQYYRNISGSETPPAYSSSPGFKNVQDFGNSPRYGSSPSDGPQAVFENAPEFKNLPGYSPQQGFGSNLGCSLPPGSGYSPGFENVPEFGNTPGYGSSPSVGPLPGFGNAPGFGNPSGYSPQQGFVSNLGCGLPPGYGNSAAHSHLPGYIQLPGFGNASGHSLPPGFGNAQGFVNSPLPPGFGSNLGSGIMPGFGNIPRFGNSLPPSFPNCPVCTRQPSLGNALGCGLPPAFVNSPGYIPQSVFKVTWEKEPQLNAKNPYMNSWETNYSNQDGMQNMALPSGAPITFHASSSPSSSPHSSKPFPLTVRPDYGNFPVTWEKY